MKEDDVKEPAETVMACARTVWCLAKDEDMDDATRKALMLVSEMLEEAASL